jgi:hypothetical protein
MALDHLLLFLPKVSLDALAAICMMIELVSRRVSHTTVQRKSKGFRTMTKKDNTTTQTTPKKTGAKAKSAGAAAATSTEDKIRSRAYSKWEKAGCPPGDGINFWLEAEGEITGK